MPDEAFGEPVIPISSSTLATVHIRVVVGLVILSAPADIDKRLVASITPGIYFIQGIVGAKRAILLCINERSIEIDGYNELPDNYSSKP